MDEDAALAEIQRAAQATLDAWPEARAAVLFGSRARGNHRPDSDWDVAFIVKGDGDWKGSVPDGVTFRHRDVRQYVNEIAISERLVERKALSIGHVGRGIATDGKILAGEWTRPKTEGKPFMETERYKQSLGTALDMVDATVEALAKLGRRDSWELSLRKADRYVACTADAAEHLAKAIMGRLGLDAYPSHEMDILSRQAREAGHETLADEFLRMNGATREDHVARYKGADAESLTHAMARLPVVLDLMRKELEGLPADYLEPKEIASLVSGAVDVFRDGAANLRAAIERDGPDLQPPPPYDWIAPLIKSREALAATLDATSDALRTGLSGSGNEDWQPPEPSPFGENPFP
ncbi:MAG: nucleotidyltransferase domain-containing protein [Boseongicola sp. SB0677_bin_26]|nr:nucleotidyltransferase domain-containing protein [Boseongicola sp. SB0665_bin_10]MYG25662.1 nucleotidyltransferase domain-containing protein [Boseongicola sp. SB0677_bin_26]